MRGGGWDGDWNADDGEIRPEETDDGWTEAGRRISPRAKVIYAVVVGAAMLVSIVLCCAAAGQVGRLLWLDLPPP